MQRQTYDPTGNPEELDGMETFHPDGPLSATLTPDGLSRDTDRTMVDKKNRAAIGSAFGEGGREKVFRWVISPPSRSRGESKDRRAECSVFFVCPGYIVSPYQIRTRTYIPFVTLMYHAHDAARTTAHRIPLTL